MGHAIINQNMKPTLLTMPREVRNQMYGYFVTIDRSAEYLPETESRERFDLRITAINRQTREEALDVLKTSNLWVYLRVIQDDTDAQGAEALTSKLLAYEQPSLHTGDAEMALIKDSAILQIIVEQDDFLEQSGLPDLEIGKATLLAYSQRTYARLVQALWNHVDSYNMLIVAPLSSSLPMGLDITDTFLEPLSIIRGVQKACIFPESPDPLIKRIQKNITSTVAWDYSKLISIVKSFQAAGYQALTEKNYIKAIYYYDRGSLAADKCADIVISASLDASRPDWGDFRSICSDMQNQHTLAVNQLVESRRGTPATREITVVSLEQLNAGVLEAYCAFWVGISDEQRCKAHYGRGIALES